MSPLSSPIEIQSLTALEHAGHSSAALRAGIVNIFRATAATWPSDDNDARAFQHLWLDQYLKHERDLVFVAHANGTIVGYLVGCQINPASSPRFQTLNYFQTFAPYCTAYPAHLHVNLDAAIRGQAVGARLIEAFCARLRADQCPGVHVVTGATMRNVSFYQRLGFREIARAPRGISAVLFLGRDLTE
jgi:ribosomal protein S18 acetylase RimI-like enzyme